VHAVFRPGNLPKGGLGCVWVFETDQTEPFCANNRFEECGLWLSSILGFCKGY